MYRTSQLIATTDSRCSLTNDSHTFPVHFVNHNDTSSLLGQLNSLGPHSGKNLSLHLENLTGNDLLPVIDVYLNFGKERFPDEKNHVGAMALYGLGESSIRSATNDGAGQDKIFDVSQLFSQLYARSDMPVKQFKITLIPARPLPADAILSIGRITLYYNEQ